MKFEEIEVVYKKLEGKLTPSEFKAKVEEKLIALNGLCDAKTAAIIVARDILNNQNFNP